MDTRERIALLEEAQGNLLDAIENIRRAVRGTDLERSTEDRVVSWLRVIKDSDHNFMSRDTNLEDLMEDLRACQVEP